MSNYNEDEIHDNDPLASHILKACFTKVNEIEFDSSPSWFLNSSASHYVSSNRYVFSSIKTNTDTKITFVGGYECSVI